MSATCERARRWVSLRLDGELSELERRLLDAHLERCAACSGFAVQVTSLTGELRSCAVEPLSRPIAVRRPVGFHVRGLRVLSTAAASIAVVGLAAVLAAANLNKDVTPSRRGDGAARLTGKLVRDIGAAPRGYASVSIRRLPPAAESNSVTTFPGPQV